MEALTKEQIEQLERIEEKLDKLLRYEGIIWQEEQTAKSHQAERELDIAWKSRD